MKRSVLLLTVWFGASGALAVFAQSSPPSRLPVLIPESAGKVTGTGGFNSHNHLRVLVAGDASAATTTQFNTPAMIRSAYNLPSTGGSGAIALVDAYHYPTALQDFNVFSKQFGLPQEPSNNPTSAGNRNFQVIYAAGVKPQSGGNYIASWDLEMALDIEWAHAIAPNAKIYLVEAASDSIVDLNNAVSVAAKLPGVKEISMSWGGDESPAEAQWYDTFYVAYGIVYFAAGGDTSDLVEYPSASVNVVSCGGTTLTRNAQGVLLSETAWADAGCGMSQYEPRPAYQNAIVSIVGSRRGVNDMSFDADPNSGVYVYDSTPLWGSGGWWILGGTSLASPCLAGVVNQAAASGSGFASNTAGEQNRIYANLKNSKVFRDITSGVDGTQKSSVGWDYITGAGSPIGLVGK